MNRDILHGIFHLGKIADHAFLASLASGSFIDSDPPDFIEVIIFAIHVKNGMIPFFDMIREGPLLIGKYASFEVLICYPYGDLKGPICRTTSVVAYFSKRGYNIKLLYFYKLECIINHRH